VGQRVCFSGGSQIGLVLHLLPANYRYSELAGLPREMERERGMDGERGIRAEDDRE